MGAPYQDGTYPSGAPILAISTANYVCNDFKISKTAETENVQDQNGAHSGAFSREGPKRGTAELQFSSNAVPEPQTAAVNATWGTFSANIDGANTTCFIDSVDINQSAKALKTASIGFQVKKN